MYTHGRKTLYSSISENDLNAENIRQILESSLISLHETNKIESQYLKDYYIGIQDIMHKQKQTRPEINNILVENWTFAITEFVKSYLLNEPIQYVQVNESVPKNEIVALNKYMDYENKSYKDSDLLGDIVLTGRAYRYIAPDTHEDEDEAPFELENINANDCEVVYSSSIGHKQLFSFVETKMVRKEREQLTDLSFVDVWKEYSIYTVYTKNRMYKYTNRDGVLEYTEPVEAKDEILYPEGHRIIEFYFNKYRFSLLEAVKPILDKINQLESLDMDDMEQFVNALMIFKNANITEETIRQGKELGALLLKSDGNLAADVALLQGRLRATDTQTFYKRLLDATLAIIAMPFASDNGGYGDTGTARMTGQGWTMADQRSNALISALLMSEKQVLRNIINICKASNSEIVSLKASDVEIRYRVNKNANVLEKTQALINMKTAQVAPSVAFTTCKIFNDDQNAIMQSEEYYGKDSFWKTPTEGNSVRDIQKQNNDIEDIEQTESQQGDK